MIYDLSKQIDVQRSEKRFKALKEEQTIITLTKKMKRTLNQNNYLHLILVWFAIELGYSLTEAKKIYKDLSTEIYHYEKNGRPFVRSSKDLDTFEMTMTIERFRNYSSREGGVYLPEPHEKEFLQEIEIEMSRNEHI